MNILKCTDIHMQVPRKNMGYERRLESKKTDPKKMSIKYPTICLSKVIGYVGEQKKALELLQHTKNFY